MNSCRKNRKAIVWLAIDALDASQTAELRAHLQTCEACRFYFEQISRVKQNLTDLNSIPPIQPTEAFHKRIVRALSKEESPMAWTAALPDICRTALSWRVALPALCAIALAFLALTTFQRRPASPPVASTSVQSIQTPNSHADLPPTIGNYRAVANQSLDEFDDLLTRQGKRTVPTLPAFRATTLALVNIAD